ncbi:hypothetical protein BX616_008367 [Lobosporangium transversale]|nr:hypothetical protein BX616_008367 [Lobosporangium transversale]
MEPHPLHIPEIIEMLASSLTRKDLVICLTVSKTFHDTLIRLVWRSIDIKSHRLQQRKRLPAGEVLQRHKHLIGELQFSGYFPKEFMSLRGCKSLRIVRYLVRGRSTLDIKRLRSFVDLVRAHKNTIQEVEYEWDIGESSELSDQDLWGVLVMCPNLNILTIHNKQIRGEDIDAFFRVCKKLRCLVLRTIIFLQPPTDLLDQDNDVLLSRIRTLELSNVIVVDPHPHSSMYYLGMLIRKCPNIRTLTYETDCLQSIHSQEQMSHDFIKAAFLQDPWTLPHLQNLILRRVPFSDIEMAAVLRRMTQLKRLQAPYCEFGPLCLQELLRDRGLQDSKDLNDEGTKEPRRFCDMLEVLEFNQYAVESRGMTQAILSSCPQLTSLYASKITMTEIIDGAEWVSTELTELIIDLEYDLDTQEREGVKAERETEEALAQQRMVYNQLGKLKRLKTLYLTGSGDDGKRTVDLRLIAGLDKMAGLKNLRHVEFRGDFHQQIQAEDARWIVNNWPMLEYLNGNMNKDPSRLHLLSEIFDANEILYDISSSPFHVGF